jgi:hypothetical protein
MGGLEMRAVLVYIVTGESSSSSYFWKSSCTFAHLNEESI